MDELQATHRADGGVYRVQQSCSLGGVERNRRGHLRGLDVCGDGTAISRDRATEEEGQAELSISAVGERER